jgi:4-hydroxybenzoate polyprenyltransferase
MGGWRSYLGLFKLSRTVFFLEVVLGYLVASSVAVGWPQVLLLLGVFISLSLLLYPGLYTINDLFDLKSDRHHPEKRSRPIASGAISVKAGIVFSLVVIFAGLVVGYFISVQLFIIELLFVAINMIYSSLLKRIPYVELVSNGLTHPLRFYLGVVMAGGYGYVLLAFSILFMSTAFSALKRENEILKEQASFRKALKRYSLRQLYVIYVLVVLLLGASLFYVEGVSRSVIAAEMLILLLVLVCYHSSRSLQKRIDPFLRF